MLSSREKYRQFVSGAGVQYIAVRNGIVAMENDRIYAVASILFDYVKSPSLRHVRDPHSIHKLAKEIVQAVDRAGSIWEKWEGQREELAKAARPCWIPIEDLRAFLNRLPGPVLTSTDVAQRLRTFNEEPYSPYPNDELKAGCLAFYESEKAQGTELPAIIGALQDYIEREEEQLRLEREQTYRRNQDEEKMRRQQRFLAGADCGWTQIDKSEVFYCRRNGRAYRVVRAKDKRWNLCRIKIPEDAGVLLGTYQGRREASKALEKIAYEPESQW